MTLTPLVELRRVLQLARAYRYVEEPDAAVGQWRYEEAAAAYQLAIELAPEIAELKAWATIARVQMGQEHEAMALFETAFLADSGLVELLPRVAALGLVQVDPTLLEQIAALAPRQGIPPDNGCLGEGLDELITPGAQEQTRRGSPK